MSGGGSSLDYADAMTSLRLAAVVLCVSSCAAAPTTGVAELTVTVTPANFSAIVTELTGTVHATDAKGLIGQGKVTFTVDVGTVEPAEATLDAYGAARFVWTCSSGCGSGGRVTATWKEPAVRVSRNAGFDLVATTWETGAGWKITGSMPSGTDWATQLNYDDRSWTPAVVIVPKKAGQDADSIWDVGPTVTSGSVKIYTRATFTLTGTVVTASLKFACNDDMEVWLNGTRLINDTNGLTTYELISDVAPQLVAGQNLVAASCGDVVLPEHGFWGLIAVQTR